jgi:hypothetical protein
MFEKLFPNRELRIVKGKLIESGTSHLDGQEDKGAQRWVKVNGEIITRVSDGLYHAQWDDEVAVVCDKYNYMVGYWNFTKGSGSDPNYSASIGSSTLVVLIVLTSMLFNFIPMSDRDKGDIITSFYNYIWKDEFFVKNWWATAAIIGLFSVYGFIWTPIYAIGHIKREREAAAMLLPHRSAVG